MQENFYFVVENKTGKIKDIKETVSGAVEILHQFRSPGVQESIAKISTTAQLAKEIIKDLKTPEMIKNLENIRAITENIKITTEKIESSVIQLDKSGIIGEAKTLICDTRGALNSLSGDSQTLPQISSSFREMIDSIRDMMFEIKMTVIDSRKSGTISNIKESLNDLSEIYKTTVNYKN